MWFEEINILHHTGSRRLSVRQRHSSRKSKAVWTPHGRCFQATFPARSSIRPTPRIRKLKSVRQAVADLLSDGEEINLRHNVVRLMANALVQTWERADCKMPLGTHRKGALTRAVTMLLDMAGTSIGRDVVSDALRDRVDRQRSGAGRKKMQKMPAKRPD